MKTAIATIALLLSGCATIPESGNCGEILADALGVSGRTYSGTVTTGNRQGSYFTRCTGSYCDTTVGGSEAALAGNMATAVWLLFAKSRYDNCVMAKRKGELK